MHGIRTTWDFRDFLAVPGRVNHDGCAALRFSEPDNRFYDVFPPFHLAGFLTKIMVPLYNLTAPIFGPPLRPPSGVLAAEMIRLHKPRGAAIPPSILEQLYHEHGGPDIFKRLDVLLLAGGPLPQVIGDEISKHTTLCQLYGSTEAGQIWQLVPLPEDWSYIQFHPNERFKLQPANEGMFELVPFAGKDLEEISALYHNYPDVCEWRTKDLFKPHPTYQVGPVEVPCSQRRHLSVFKRGKAESYSHRVFYTCLSRCQWSVSSWTGSGSSRPSGRAQSKCGIFI
jgi:hypothetical protein